MQVNMHGIERVELVDYGKSSTHPFFIARLYDGNRSAVDISLTCKDDAVKLAEIAMDALGMWAND